MSNAMNYNFNIVEVDKKVSYYEIREFNNLYEILSFLLALRLPVPIDYYKDFNWYKCLLKDESDIRKKILPTEKEQNKNQFWSFRGQKNEDWFLSITPHTENYGKHLLYEEWFKQYKKRMVALRGEPDHIDKENDWNWLFYAKHHDLYTRLLDWSSNPLIAIYFAVENITLNQNNKKSALWALKVDRNHFCSVDELPRPYNGLSPAKGIFKGLKADNQEWFMVNPEPVTNRIVIQSGKFTFHCGNKPKPIDKIPRRDGETLIKLVINYDAHDTIRKQLGVMNIHHASLFPSPSGIACFVSKEWPDIAKY